jgi:hypothetical protein
MKSLRIAASLVALLVSTLSAQSQSATQPAAAAQSAAQQSFEQLKTLAGEWEGKNSEGMPLRVSFEDTAGGTALMSQIRGHGPQNMVSMIHMDGSRLVMTHYCSAGNQPRMAATASPDGKTITFAFFDATNLATPDSGHMQRLVIAVVDSNHHTEDWTFSDHGKEMKEFFDLHRTEVAKN